MAFTISKTTSTVLPKHYSSFSRILFSSSSFSSSCLAAALLTQPSSSSNRNSNSKMNKNTSPISIQQQQQQRTTSSNSNTSSNSDGVLRPLIVCGPSGVGKGTIIDQYMKQQKQKKSSLQFAFTVSHTTRQPRPKEIDGIHYHFTTPDEIQTSIQNGEFLEYANVHGNWYGTSLSSVQAVQETQSNDNDDDDANGGVVFPLLDIDVQGVKNVKTQVQSETTKLEPRYIFIAPPSMDALQQRLLARGTETKESLEKRTKNAKDEMEYGMKDGNFDEIVVNDDLNKAVNEFTDAVSRLYSNMD